MNKPKVFLRADGDSKIGLGHLMRSKALADILDDYFDCIFIITSPEPVIVKEFSSTHRLIALTVSDLQDEILQLKSFITKADIFVADGYHFDRNYQTEIQKIAKKLVMIDDLADRYFSCDVILNHGDISSLPAYQKAKKTKLFSGLDYLILRNEFLEAAKSPRSITDLKTAFICMGGADPFGITVKVVKAVAKCDFIEKVTIVTGSAYIQKVDLDITLRDLCIPYLHVHNLNAVELRGIIQESDLSITSASTIALEVCCVKSVLLTGICVENQRAIHSILSKSGSCYSTGDFNSVDENDIAEAINRINGSNLIQNIIENQISHFDGGSSRRIVSIFKSLAA